MSIQQPRRSEHSENFGAATGAMSAFDDGYELHPIIHRAAVATSSQWVDAVVVEASPDGTIALARLEDGVTETRWHHADLGGILLPGSPIALHSVYSVLATGDALVSVRAL